MTDGQYRFLLLFIAVCTAVGAAVASQPHHSTFGEVLSASIDAAFGSGAPGANEVLARDIGGLRCTTAPDACESRIRTGLEVAFSNYVVVNLAEVTFEGHDVTRCFGAFNLWVCER